MVDFSAWLERKYAIQQQQADADTTRADSGAALQYAQAGMIRPNSIAENALKYSQANAANVGAQLAPDIAQSGNDERRAQTGNLNSQTAMFNQLASTDAINNFYGARGLPSPVQIGGRVSSGATPSSVFDPTPEDKRRYAKGTARVPGMGSPKVDSVPAQLAPGEAVLNQPAAETMGRGLIAALNKMGASKLGLV